jgi:hypothetical protein
MSTTSYQEQLHEAEIIVNDLGHTLADNTKLAWGIPESRLPHTKDKIKNAIQLLIWELGHQETEVTNRLAEAYVFLALFIPDEDVETLSRGQAALQSNNPEHPDWECAVRAEKILNTVKLDMENALEEIQIFLRGNNIETNPD